LPELHQTEQMSIGKNILVEFPASPFERCFTSFPVAMRWIFKNVTRLSNSFQSYTFLETHDEP
jgi:hypothetical protein